MTEGAWGQNSPPAAATSSSIHKTRPCRGHAHNSPRLWRDWFLSAQAYAPLYHFICLPSEMLPETPRKRPNWFRTLWFQNPRVGFLFLAHSHCVVTTTNSLLIKSTSIWKCRFCHIRFKVWVQNSSLDRFNKTKNEQKSKRIQNRR